MNRLEKMSNLILPAAAILMTVAVLHREFWPAPASAARVDAPPKYIKDWEHQVDPIAERIGSSKAPIQLVEFADFECPFCRRYDSVLVGIRQKYGDRVSTQFVHYPLTIHRFARPAARAAECAAQQGRFEEFAGLLFQKADSLGLKPWSAYASDANVAHMGEFESCVRDTAAVPRIEAGVKLGKQLGIPGTPSVMLNGWLFGAAPHDSVLRAKIDSILAR